MSWLKTFRAKHSTETSPVGFSAIFAAALALATFAGCLQLEIVGSPGGVSALSISSSQFLGGRWIDSSGNFYVADTGNNAIREVTASNGDIKTVAGSTSLALRASLNNPVAVAFDSLGKLYVADSNDNVVRKFDLQTGDLTIVAGNLSSGYSGDLGPAVNTQLDAPEGLALDSSNNLYISDSSNNVIAGSTP